jgi:hypothetical protein
MVGRSAGLFVLTILQALFAGLGVDTAAIFGALHGLNALVIAGLSAHVFMAARAYGGSPVAAPAAGPASPARACDGPRAAGAVARTRRRGWRRLRGV